MLSIYFAHPDKLPSFPPKLRVKIIKYIIIDQKANISFSLAKDQAQPDANADAELSDLRIDGELPLFLCWSKGLIKQYLDRRYSLTPLEFTGSKKAGYRFDWAHNSKDAVFKCNHQGLIQRVDYNSPCLNGLKFLPIGIPAGIVSLQGEFNTSISDLVAVTGLLSRFTGPLLNGYTHFGNFGEDSSSSSDSSEDEEEGKHNGKGLLKKAHKGILKHFRKIPEIVINESSGNTTHPSRQKRAIRSLSFSFINNNKKDGFENRPQRRKSTDSLEARDHLPKAPEKSFLIRALALGKSETDQKKKEAKKAKAADKRGEANITAKDSTAISSHHGYKATYTSHGNEKEAGNGDNPESETHTSPRGKAHTQEKERRPLKLKFVLPDSAMTDSSIPQTPNIAFSSRHKFGTPNFPDNTMDGRRQPFRFVPPTPYVNNPDYFNANGVPGLAMTLQSPVTPEGFIYPPCISKEPDVGPDENPDMQVIRGFDTFDSERVMSKHTRTRDWSDWKAYPPVQASLANLSPDHEPLEWTPCAKLAPSSSCAW
ncbi:hypothetical protein RUND412_008504 [Rhizina undulata]